MPMYEYRCLKCERQFEVEQKMTDDVLKIHDLASDPNFDNCLGELVKVFSSVGIVWKGSGFYKTDTRSGTSSKPGNKNETKSSSESSKTESKPADSAKKSDSNSSSTSTNTQKSSDNSKKS